MEQGKSWAAQERPEPGPLEAAHRCFFRPPSGLLQALGYYVTSQIFCPQALCLPSLLPDRGVAQGLRVTPVKPQWALCHVHVISALGTMSLVQPQDGVCGRSYTFFPGS